jgi:beta-mannanase
MWEKVHKIFTEVGATNATWVWCPNIDTEGKFASMKSVYPKAENVDWTCLDGYNEGGTRWKSYQQLFGASYEAITNKEVAPAKPMIIGETASTESGGSKAEWITGMFSVLPTYPLIHGLLWFNKHELGPGGNEDWWIESSTAATSAFAAGLQNTLPATAEYSGLEVSPIPPSP